MEHLLGLGLLYRNPGHGHPLRPEYRLTAFGEELAEWAAQLDGLASRSSDRALLRNKWSLPLVGCLSREQRYADLRRALAPVTDRALSASLHRLTENAWLQRLVSQGVSPPRVSYRTILLGEKLHHHVRTLPSLRC